MAQRRCSTIGISYLVVIAPRVVLPVVQGLKHPLIGWQVRCTAGRLGTGLGSGEASAPESHPAVAPDSLPLLVEERTLMHTIVMLIERILPPML